MQLVLEPALDLPEGLGGQAEVVPLRVLGEGVGLDELLARDPAEDYVEAAGLGRLEHA